MTRAVLVSVFFAIGLIMLLFLSLTTGRSRGDNNVTIRSDLADWVNQRAEDTNETPGRVTERAIAAYRDRFGVSGSI